MKKKNLLLAEPRDSAYLSRSRSAGLVMAIMATALLLSACASTTSPTPIPTIALDGSSSNGDQSNTGNEVTASAIIVPIKDAQLSFPAVGRVTEVNAKVGDRVSAGDVLVRIDTTLLEAKVREAEANLEVAEIQVRYLKRIGTNQAHLETAEADVERAQALLDLAKATLDSQSTLVAPFDGVIVSVDIAPAETVTPGQVVIVLADPSRYQIETTDLSERDVTKVQIGQPATVFIEALNEEFTGEVIDIDRIGSTLGGDVVFTVTIAFDQQPQGLLWGMSADARIQTDQ